VGELVEGGLSLAESKLWQIRPQIAVKFATKNGGHKLSRNAISVSEPVIPQCLYFTLRAKSKKGISDTDMRFLESFYPRGFWQDTDEIATFHKG
jgi:hypothetical protein